jgi:signal transduction histidine kinase
LNAIVSEVLTDLELEIEKHGAQIKIESLPEIEASEFQMRQLFQNLISNSLKFSQAGRDCQIEMRAARINELSFEGERDENGRYCRIEVIDNGIGFEEQFLEKIFLLFQRLDHEDSEGTGIGLAIVKKVVATHGGIITAKSKKNQGSSFIFILPLKQNS